MRMDVCVPYMSRNSHGHAQETSHSLATTGLGLEWVFERFHATGWWWHSALATNTQGNDMYHPPCAFIILRRLLSLYAHFNGHIRHNVLYISSSFYKTNTRFVCACGRAFCRVYPYNISVLHPTTHMMVTSQPSSWRHQLSCNVPWWRLFDVCIIMFLIWHHYQVCIFCDVTITAYCWSCLYVSLPLCSVSWWRHGLCVVCYDDVMTSV